MSYLLRFQIMITMLYILTWKFAS